jgi:hypothetical protein
MAPKCGNVACLGGVSRARVRADAPRRRLRRQYPNGRRFPRPREPSSPRAAHLTSALSPRKRPCGARAGCPRVPPRPPPCATPAACCARPARPASPRARRGSFRSSSLKNEARSFSSSRLFLASVLRFRKKKALRDDRRGNRARRRSTRPFPPFPPAFPRSHAFSDANDPRRYKRGWFCSWCSTVYRKREEEDDEKALGAAGPGAKLWVGCDRCDRWSHLSCELANDPACLGTGREVPFEAAPALCFPSDVTPHARVDHAFFVDQKTEDTKTVRRTYHCPSCRERDGEKKK